MIVAPLDEATAPAWRALFEECGSGCFCRYWGFEGGKNEWLARSSTEPRRNLDEQLALVRRGAPDARGLIALDGDAALGWMKLAPRAFMGKLLRQGAYRALDLGPGEGAWVVGCLLVHPAHRGRGVARRLVAAADEHVRAWGGRAIEAYPRGAPASAELRLHDEEAWMGTEALFAAAGFATVAGDAAYPVMRKALA